MDQTDYTVKRAMITSFLMGSIKSLAVVVEMIRLSTITEATNLPPIGLLISIPNSFAVSSLLIFP